MTTATMTEQAARVAIALEHDCADESCGQLARRHHEQLQAYRDACSLLELGDGPGWLAAHRTARKRATRARARGYRVEPIDRSLYADDIYAINTSTPERQGRPMTAGYQTRPAYTPLEAGCQRHRVNCYGVLDSGGRLVAYAFVYRLGELALVSQILGHHDHLPFEVMYLLVAGVVDAEADQAGWLFYNRHDSGTDGLRFFKERCGFQPSDIEWLQ